MMFALAAWGQDARDLLPEGVVEEVRVGARTVRVHRVGARWWISAADPTGERVLVPTGGDRVAVSPDGEQVAYVAPRDGIAAVWVVPFAGGAAAPVTPAVTPARGRAPDGWVAPPTDRSLRFTGDSVCWTPPAGVGETCARWR
jgi:hypothetical protein